MAKLNVAPPSIEAPPDMNDYVDTHRLFAFSERGDVVRCRFTCRIRVAPVCGQTSSEVRVIAADSSCALLTTPSSDTHSFSNECKRNSTTKSAQSLSSHPTAMSIGDDAAPTSGQSLTSLRKPNAEIANVLVSRPQKTRLSTTKKTRRANK